MVWTAPFMVDLGYVPPPPPLPKYDPEEEPPMWNWKRISWNLPVDKGPKEWTPIGTQPASSSDPDWRGVIRDNVREYPMPETYNNGHYNSPMYFWFDTPDYADPFKKLGYATIFFAKAGFAVAALRGVCEGRVGTLASHLSLIRSTFGPWLIGGLAASLTVTTLANLRGKKDDVWNYLPAGFLFGAILGRRQANQFFRCVALATPAAAYIKYNAEYNGKLIPVWNNRVRRYGFEGQSAQDGIGSGDLRFGYRGTTLHGDPGRDVRTYY